jgi:hypothetical protein
MGLKVLIPTLLMRLVSPVCRIPAECFDEATTRAVHSKDGSVAVQIVADEKTQSAGVSLRTLAATQSARIGVSTVSKTAGLSGREDGVCKLDDSAKSRKIHLDRVSRLKGATSRRTKGSVSQSAPKGSYPLAGAYAPDRQIPSETAVQRKRRPEAARVDKENLKLAVAMQAIYQMGPDSSLRKKFDRTGIARPTGIAYKDCRPIWRQRTELFLGDRDVRAGSCGRNPRCRAPGAAESATVQRGGKVCGSKEQAEAQKGELNTAAGEEGTEGEGKSSKGLLVRTAGASIMRVVIEEPDVWTRGTTKQGKVDCGQHIRRPSSAPTRPRPNLAVVKTTVLTQDGHERTYRWGANRTVPATIPKTVGVAVCAGCGFKSFAGADGRSLQTCAKCQAVFYCSLACALVDAASHRAECGHVTAGRWQPFRPVEQNWVVSGSMAKERAELKRALASQTGKRSVRKGRA